MEAILMFKGKERFKKVITGGKEEVLL